jgi:GntR family transcriptional regulator of arabinose operon
MAADHLLDLGHRDIGLIMKMDDKQGANRLEGFLSAAAKRQIVFRADWARFFTTEGKDRVAALYARKIAAADKSERPSAVFCYNDEIAVELLKEASQLNIAIPQDLSIVGFDDSELGRLAPGGLTSIAHPKSKMGFEVADRLLARLRGELIDTIIFQPELVARSTTMMHSASHDVMML